MVTAASASGNEAGKQLLIRTAAAHPTITKARADRLAAVSTVAKPATGETASIWQAA